MSNMLIPNYLSGTGGLLAVGSEPANTEQTTTTMIAHEPNNVAGTTKARPKPTYTLIWMVLIFVIMYFLLFRGPKKKQQQHKKMVQALQKNDKVRTIGGIIGTIVDIKDDEITLKVDESNNTKIKVASSAIGKNVSQNKIDLNR